MNENTCPVCGTEVKVLSGDEGTSHYQPVGDVQSLKAENAKLNSKLYEFKTTIDCVDYQRCPPQCRVDESPNGLFCYSHSRWIHEWVDKCKKLEAENERLYKQNAELSNKVTQYISDFDSLSKGLEGTIDRGHYCECSNCGG